MSPSETVKIKSATAQGTPNIAALDKRLYAYRPDLADKRLQGRVRAAHFTAGVKARIAVPVANLYRIPRPCCAKKADMQAQGEETKPARAGAETQLLLGAALSVFERRGGMAWVQAETDSYVGYIEEKALAAADNPLFTGEPTHYVAVPRTFLYSEADLRAAPVCPLSLGSRLTITGEEVRRGTHYALLANGQAVIAGHIQPLGCFAADYVAVAETLLHTPYLWGGASAFGIDCSGLVQLALQMSGRQAPRDSDMQAAEIGARLECGAKQGNGAEDLSALRRGDLVFWRGHVAILCSKTHIIHANGATMRVSIEPLQAALDRIAPLYGEPIAFRRP